MWCTSALNASGRLVSFSSEGEEVWHFRKVAGVSIVAVGGLCFMVDMHFNSRQPSGLNKL